VAAIAATWLAVRARTALDLRDGRADQVGAARWVESKVDLDQRLLSLVATPEASRSALWGALEEDNRAALPRWADRPLGIPRIPAIAALPVAGLLAALLTLVPLSREPQSPPELATREPEVGGAADAEGDTQPSAVGAGTTQAPGPAGGGEGRSRTIEGSAPGGREVREMLASRFERSVAGRALGPPPPAGARPPGSADDPPQAGTDAKPGGVGQSKNQPGGRPPDASLARLERGEGGTKTMSGAGGGGSGTKPSSGGKPTGESRPAGPDAARDAKGQGGQPPRSSDGRQDAPVGDGDATGAKAPGGGGSAAGSGKGGAMLASHPLVENAHQSARFALTLGAGRRDAAPGHDGTPDDPHATIAEVARGEQAAERHVRHEQIPAEYERVVKRVFAREP
ncbi:MAG: hypothetical protein ACKOCT_14070, partial [Alphaproteobacteria bacterium]